MKADRYDNTTSRRGKSINSLSKVTQARKDLTLSDYTNIQVNKIQDTTRAKQISPRI